ncbi:hypothetical protein ACIQOW_03750 [Kitasatospora sp. NPDC091335]|uniref:hypothetical protein n=1 Tax=Kitasatospora sp. NPDC091335 TaxID=3364085 RepID=UPI0038235925
MSIRLDQLPRGASWLAEQVADLKTALAQLRAQQPDMAAADGLLAPQDTDTTRWPQTSSTSYAPVARCYNVAWKRGVRVMAATTVASGTTGQVRVTVNGVQLGAAVPAGTLLDVTAPLPASAPIGTQYLIAIEAVRTSGAGSVGAQVQLIRATD